MKQILARLSLTSAFRLALLWQAALAIVFTGCAGKQLTPAFVGVAAQTLVATTLRNSPNTATEMQVASAILCAASGGTNVSPQSIHDSLGVQNFNLSTVALLNGLQMIYTQALSAGTAYTAQDYARAVFCDGIPAGLNMLPGPRSGPLPRGTLPPVPQRPAADPRFPLWEK